MYKLNEAPEIAAMSRMPKLGTCVIKPTLPSATPERIELQQMDVISMIFERGLLTYMFKAL